MIPTGIQSEKTNKKTDEYGFERRGRDVFST
jgi:hypothetical protein